MVKHTQTIRREFANELLNVFDHFMRLALKFLKEVLLIAQIYLRY